MKDPIWADLVWAVGIARSETISHYHWSVAVLICLYIAGVLCLVCLRPFSTKNEWAKLITISVIWSILLCDATIIVFHLANVNVSAKIILMAICACIMVILFVQLWNLHNDINRRHDRNVDSLDPLIQLLRNANAAGKFKRQQEEQQKLKDPYPNQKFLFIQSLKHKKVRHLVKGVDYDVE